MTGFGLVAAAPLTFNTFFVFLPSQLVRALGLPLSRVLAAALLGGTAPFVCTLLVERTGDPLVPAWYATAMTLAAAVGVVLLRETAFQPLTGEDATPAGQPADSPQAGDVRAP